jgi:hypothetical protein
LWLPVSTWMDSRWKAERFVDCPCWGASPGCSPCLAESLRLAQSRDRLKDFLLACFPGSSPCSRRRWYYPASWMAGPAYSNRSPADCRLYYYLDKCFGLSSPSRCCQRRAVGPCRGLCWHSRRPAESVQFRSLVACSGLHCYLAGKSRLDFRPGDFPCFARKCCSVCCCRAPA